MGFFLAVLLLAASGLAALAQPKSFTVMKNFQWTDFYDPPHEQQLRWLLKGAEARPQASGGIPVRQVTLEGFQKTGTREVLVELPECHFDPTTREASSPGPLRMQLQEGRFTLEGEGFLWQHTNAFLVISNRVRTTIRGGWQPAQNASPAVGDAQVLSDQFVYYHQRTQAVYRGNVRVTTTNLALTCGRMSFTVPTTNTGSVDKLLAEQGVTIDADALHASAGRLDYEPASGVIQLKENAEWQAQGREGRAEELRLESATKSLLARGAALLKLPLSGAGFMPHKVDGATPAEDSSNRIVTISSERYELQTNEVRFAGGVQAIERAGEAVRSRLVCESLRATLGASNELQTLVAEQGVLIEQGERRLTGTRATYDGATGALEFTGQPVWRDGGRSGSGELVRADLRREELAVRGNAILNLPRTQADNLFGALLGGDTNRLGQSVQPDTTAATSPMRITSGEYNFSPEAVVFRGQVRVEDARMQLTTDALALKLAPGGTNVVSITADQNVVMSLVETNGQTTRVTCARAVYAAADGVLELTGQPQLQRTDGARFTADVISYVPATGELSARGEIRSTVVVPGRGETNAPAMPFKAKPARRKK